MTLSILSFIDFLGAFALAQLTFFIKTLRMIYFSLRSVFTSKTESKRSIVSVISSQIYFTGYQALPLISFLALCIGSLLFLQSSSQLNLLQDQMPIGQLMNILVIRELAPFLTALVVIARSGTAVAAEVGNMVANREIEALEVMGINPLSYIVFPRLVGGLISVICLSVYFSALAMVGGFFITTFFHSMPFDFYMNTVITTVSFEDLFSLIVKSLFSGFMIFALSCTYGLSIKKSLTEVPIATTQAVVKSIIYVVGFNLSVTVLYYFIKFQRMSL